jgi:hypothetical protein
MANDISLILRLIGKDDGASSALGDTAQRARELGDNLKDIDGNPLREVGTSAEDARDGIGDASVTADEFKEKLKDVREAGVALTAIGAVGMAISEHFADAYVEADRLGGKMSTLMSGAGLSGSIDAVKELGNEIAGLAGSDDDEVAAKLSGAIASGRLNGLREFGIRVDAAGVAAIKAANDISEAAGKQETLNQVMRAGAQAVEDMRANTSEATQSIGEFGVRMGNLEESVGEGSASVKASLIDGILNPILDIIDKDEGLKATAGSVFSIGSMATAGIGGIVSLGAQVGLTALAFKSMGITGVESIMAIEIAGAPVVATLGTIALAVAAVAAACYVLYNAAGMVGAQLKEAVGGKWAEQIVSTAGIVMGGAGGLAIQHAANQINAPAVAPKAAGAADPVAAVQKQIADLQAKLPSISTPSIPTVGGDDESDGEESAPTAVGGSKGAKKAEAARLKAEKASEGLIAKAQKEKEREQKKVDRFNEQESKRQSRENLELARARIEAASENQVFDLEQQLAAATDQKNQAAMQALTVKIAEAKAQADYQKAVASAGELAEEGRGTQLEIARLKYQSALRNVKLPTVSGKAGTSVAQAIGSLQAGGNVFSLGKKFGASGGGNASGGGASTRAGIDVPVRNQVSQEPNGDFLVRFVIEPIRLSAKQMKNAVLST